MKKQIFKRTVQRGWQCGQHEGHLKGMGLKVPEVLVKGSGCRRRTLAAGRLRHEASVSGSGSTAGRGCQPNVRITRRAQTYIPVPYWGMPSASDNRVLFESLSVGLAVGRVETTTFVDGRVDPTSLREWIRNISLLWQAIEPRPVRGFYTHRALSSPVIATFPAALHSLFHGESDRCNKSR